LSGLGFADWIQPESPFWPISKVVFEFLARSIPSVPSIREKFLFPGIQLIKGEKEISPGEKIDEPFQ
jgi:hypothetical protein